MNKKLLTPDYIFESSWEVCNKVGGIYTVLSTRAKTLQEKFEDKIIFIGPDFWKEKESPYFREEPSLFAEWQWEAKEQGLKVRVGRWTVPGEPIAVLVDFTPYFEKKNEIYTWLWENYRVDSLHAYGDYDEASMFSYAAGLVVESFYHHSLSSKQKVVYHANEWMCGLGALYIKNKLPQIATIEKQTAWHVDCFTTVSDITANECKELLDKPVDVVLPNGFDNSFVPKAASFTKKRKAARQKMLQVANALLGENLDDETIIVSTSGRYEFRNKGIDVFVEAMNRLLRDRDLKKKVLAFIVVPGWVGEPRKDLQERLESGKSYDTPLEVPQVTHWLHNMGHDSVLNMMKYYDMHNRHEDNVKVVFLPDYLDGRDGIMNLTYYDVVLGNDLCIYPSYYEPWGYTPLEAVAFKVPCITTDLAGFGLWANKEFGHEGQLQDGVRVIHRTDYNYSEVADYIKDTVAEFSTMSKTEVDACRKAAETLSKKALWKEFIKYYYEAYDIALKKVVARS